MYCHSHITFHSFPLHRAVYSMIQFLPTSTISLFCGGLLLDLYRQCMRNLLTDWFCLSLLCFKPRCERWNLSDVISQIMQGLCVTFPFHPRIAHSVLSLPFELPAIRTRISLASVRCLSWCLTLEKPLIWKQHWRIFQLWLYEIIKHVKESQ